MRSGPSSRGSKSQAFTSDAKVLFAGEALQYNRRQSLVKVQPAAPGHAWPILLAGRVVVPAGCDACSREAETGAHRCPF